MYMKFFYTVLCFFSSMLYSLTWHNLILLCYNTQWGCLYLVSLFHSKLSNLRIKFYLLALTIINSFYLLRTREDCSRSIYILQVCLHLTTSLMFQGVFKICTGCFSSCLLSPRWLAWDAPASLYLFLLLQFKLPNLCSGWSNEWVNKWVDGFLYLYKLARTGKVSLH
jgi:hypothetical protein